MAKSKKGKNVNTAVSDIFGSIKNNLNKDKNQSKNLNKKSNRPTKEVNKNTSISKNKNNHPKKNNKSTKESKNKQPKQKSKNKQDVIENHYGVLPMSCTLDIRTIGKLEAAKQVLGAHNRDTVVEDLMNKSLDNLLESKGSTGKKDYKLYYKVFMMKHKTSAEHHYKQFYKNGRNSKKNK